MEKDTRSEGQGIFQVGLQHDQMLAETGLAKCSSEFSEFQCTLLTRRENDVLRCFAKGLLYKETADVLGLSYSAVHKYQHNAFRKLKVSNRSEAIMKWSAERTYSLEDR